MNGTGATAGESGDAQRREPKVLRVGVIDAGKIVGESIFRKRESVSVGEETKNTFSLAGSGLPKSFKLFESTPRGYVLLFTDAMEGRVSVNDRVVDFATLRRESLAEKKGDLWSFRLSEKSRGKVVVGKVTFLFQFVSAPAAPMRPQLPKLARGGIWETIDWIFASIIMCSFVFHFGFLIIASEMEKKPAHLIQEERFAKLVNETKALTELKKAMEQKKAPDPTKVARRDEVRREDPRDRPTARRRDDESTRPSATVRTSTGRQISAREAKAVEKAVAKVGAALVSAFGENTGATTADPLRERVDKDLERTLARAGKVSTGFATGSTTPRLSTGYDGPESASAGKNIPKITRARTTAVTQEGPKEAVVPQVKSAAPTVAIDDPEAQATIRSQIKSNFGQIKACYERSLKKNPSLRGKYVIRFTIGEGGRVVDEGLDEDTVNDSEMASCVRKSVRRWRFRIKGDAGEATITYSVSFAPQKVAQ
ncbi:MAG: AgmX/PglI C-terminal domain-containing protein [Deltaproteobacteria bacterium]|nr:AgmX/PglI C-terminal domain-containing protein [Deltaproteobacteria bacterium]